MIITINGKPGSGKSTVARKLARKLGYTFYDVGKMRREAARKRGMTLAEFNKLGESTDETDRVFDDWLIKIGKTGRNLVISGRLAFYFIPHSLKIFLDVSDQAGARRIWGALRKHANRNEASGLSSFRDVLKSVRSRIKSDTYRYKKYYKVNVFARKYYDLFLDTTPLNEREEFQAVYTYVRQKLTRRK